MSEENDDDVASRNAHLSPNDCRILVSWMEIEANFNAIHGSGNKTVVGNTTKKKDAFQMMADRLNSKTTNGALPTLNAHNMKQRWDTYKRRFKTTLSASKSETGLGLTRRELEKGMSIPEKLEVMCPQFHRMKELFADKANITPSHTLELGVPSTIETVPEFQYRQRRKQFRQTTDRPSPASGRQDESVPSASKPTRPANATNQRRPTHQEPHNKRTKSSGGDSNKKKDASTAHQTRVSLSTAYARNAQAKIDYLSEMLDEEKRQWNEKHQAEKEAQKLQHQRQEREDKECRAARQHELVLALLHQNKTTEEIEAFLLKFGK